MWWLCDDDLMMMSFIVNTRVHGGPGYEWSCTCNISLIRHILYDIVTFSLATGENWRYECTVHSRLVIHDNFPSFVSMKLGILCYKCKYRSISRDKIISNWSNNQPTLNDCRILTCLTWFMPLGSMYNVYDSTINFGCGTDD